MNEFADVGRELVERLKATVDEKVREAIALRIRTKVDAARSDPDTSSRRWPFELIQNAHDASVRAGRDNISLCFDLTDGVLRFEHDAAPFTMDEFAALLTGGSSKDFMSMETTGRFGTGFLVTHVLSEQVHVSGIIEFEGTQRSFEVDLDRPFPGDVHEVEWTAEIVSDYCRLLPGAAIPTGQTLSFVEDAEESDVPIRNVSALRYAVRSDIWEAGLDLDEWVETAFFGAQPNGLRAQ
ncbi:sacsin N-terminal ATP-binding-like domain-containing protein [Bradyrhizobium sp. USDA 3315]